MKTTEELFLKVRLTLEVVLKSNMQHGLQDQHDQDARSSWEPSGDLKSYGETCNSTVDHRTAGFVIKNNRRRGAKHGAPQRQKM